MLVADESPDVDVEDGDDADDDDDASEPVVVLSSDAPVVLVPPLEATGSPPPSELLVPDSARTNVGLGLKQVDDPRARVQTATLGRLDTPRQK